MKKKKKGLTLVELVVVMAISVILGGMIMMLFLSQNENMNYVQDSTALQNEARIVLNSLEEDIRVAKAREINKTSIQNVDGKTYTATSSEKIIYKFNEKLQGETNEKTFAYIYNTSDFTIKKFEVITTGSIASLKEIATLTRCADSKDNSGVFNAITISDESLVGSTTNKVYEIKLNLKKGKEKLNFNSRVTTRNG